MGIVLPRGYEKNALNPPLNAIIFRTSEFCFHFFNSIHGQQHNALAYLIEQQQSNRYVFYRSNLNKIITRLCFIERERTSFTL